MIHNLEDESASKELVQYSYQELGSIVENISGAYGIMAWIDDEMTQMQNLQRRRMVSHLGGKVRVRLVILVVGITKMTIVVME